MTGAPPPSFVYSANTFSAKKKKKLYEIVDRVFRAGSWGTELRWPPRALPWPQRALPYDICKPPRKNLSGWSKGEIDSPYLCSKWCYSDVHCLYTFWIVTFRRFRWVWNKDVLKNWRGTKWRNLVQEHKPGQDSNPHSLNERTLMCSTHYRPLSHNTP